MRFEKQNFCLGAVFQACESVVKSIAPKEKSVSQPLFSLIKFSTDAQLEFSKLALQWNQLHTKVSHLTDPNGTTNYIAAFKCISMNNLVSDNNFDHVVIFLSDGAPDVKGHELDTAISNVTRTSKSLVIHTIYVGTGDGGDVLKDIATRNGGTFSICTNLTNLIQAFNKVVGTIS